MKEHERVQVLVHLLETKGHRVNWGIIEDVVIEHLMGDFDFDPFGVAYVSSRFEITEKEAEALLRDLKWENAYLLDSFEIEEKELTI